MTPALKIQLQLELNSFLRLLRQMMKSDLRRLRSNVNRTSWKNPRRGKTDVVRGHLILGEMSYWLETGWDDIRWKISVHAARDARGVRGSMSALLHKGLLTWNVSLPDVPSKGAEYSRAGMCIGLALEPHTIKLDGWIPFEAGKRSVALNLVYGDRALSFPSGPQAGLAIGHEAWVNLGALARHNGAAAYHARIDARELLFTLANESVHALNAFRQTNPIDVTLLGPRRTVNAITHEEEVDSHDAENDVRTLMGVVHDNTVYHPSRNAPGPFYVPIGQDWLLLFSPPKWDWQTLPIPAAIKSAVLRYTSNTAFRRGLLERHAGEYPYPWVWHGEGLDWPTSPWIRDVSFHLRNWK